MLDIREILRRLHLGQGERVIARDLGVSRKTVRRYRVWATASDLLTGPVPDAGRLQALLAASAPAVTLPTTPFRAAPYRERILAWRAQGVECRAILERLREDVGFTGSYSGLWRFVRSLEPVTPEGFVRIETLPGEEAQVDFGSAGRMIDPHDGMARKAWVFVMVLSWSRHQYVEVVFDQEVTTWLRCHRHAFEAFGGVPLRVVIDNLKAAVVRASAHDPVVQRAYRECAEHYGFLIAPCRPRTPQHKGKVEQGGVHYVKRNFLAGRTFRDRTEANTLARQWCLTTAGQRIHGTTKERPLVRFAEVEQAALQPLPATPYAVAVWKRAKLHPDCHVVFDAAFYSAPHRLIGQTLWVRAADTSVTLFHAHALVASHPRAARPGHRQTHPDHLPPAKVVALMASPAWCLRRAHDIGPQTTELIGRLLGERPLDRLRSAMAILQLAHKYAPRRLEAACTRALAFDQTGYGIVKRILQQGLGWTDLGVHDGPLYAAGEPAPMGVAMTTKLSALTEESGRERRFRARTLRELLADPDILKPPAAVIPFLAWPGRITLLAGREKSGKSTFAGQGAAELSRGGEFLSAPLDAGGVVWVALDEPVQDLVQRLHRLGADPDGVLIADGAVDPSGLRDLIESFRPVAVVIDCLANLAVGTVRDPANAMEWGELFAHLRPLAKEFNVAIVLIHHSKKDGRVYRDSTAIGAQVDMILTMHEVGDSETRRVVEVKGRLQQRSYSVDFQGDRYELEGPVPTGHPAEERAELPRQLLEVLEGSEPEGLCVL